MAVISPNSVSLNYNYDLNVEVNNGSFYSYDGFYFTLSDLLSGAKDVAANQDNLLVLSDNFKLSDKIDNFSSIDKTQLITKSVVSFASGNTTMYLVAGTAGSNITVTDKLSGATVFTLDFNTISESVSLSAGDSLITILGTNSINMQAYRPGDASTYQYFYYTLYNDQVVLLTRSTTEILTVNNTTKTLQSVNYTNSNFTSGQLFKLNRFYFNEYNNKGESNLAKYISTPNDITVTTATSGVSFNYLISTPYKTLDATLDFSIINIAPLKNYYSPEGVQTPTLTAVSKYYNKLYTGLNTEDGNDKIYLSYKGSEITKTFAKDKDTYFHYPVSAANISLSASTLVKCGALGGSSPWRSDRISVKKANYRKYSNWGNNPGVQNGVYFCTWLSAGPAGVEPVWMDRYYDPNHINLTSALTSTAYTSAANNYPNLIWDTPSVQTLNPESLYVYHRIGDEDNQLVVDTLSSNLLHYFQNWTDPLINEATGLSAGTIYNYSASAVATLPGTRDESLDTSLSYAVATFTNEDLNNNGVTLAFQAYNTDWSNIKGSQLVGNYYDGGIGICKNNTLLTPFITVNSFNATNSLLTVNTSLAPIKYSPTGFSDKAVILKAEYDAEYYVVTSDKKIYVYDQDDLNTNTYTFNQSGGLVNAYLTKESGLKQIIVTTRPTNTSILWKKYNIDGTVSTTGTVAASSTSYNNVAFDLYNNPVYYNSLSGNNTVDNSNNVFILSGNTLIKNANTPSTKSAVLSALSAEYIACDHDDNIWLLYSNRNLCKLDNNGNVLWDVYLTNSPIVSATKDYPRIVNFVAEIDLNSKNIVHSGVVFDPKTQNIFKINSNDGSIAYTQSISGVNKGCIITGDTTGYSYQRKYVYTVENSNDITVKMLSRNITANNNSEEVINLNYDVSYLTPGWHHFAAVFNSNNQLSLYIDGNVATSTNVGSLSTIYRVYNSKNNPNLVIGTASFKKQTLAQYTNETTDIYRYNGKIADVRFYGQALQQSDIKALQKRFLLNSFTNLKWSTPTGERYYIEQIERFFLHRLPGAKSNMFNVKIKNSNITDLGLRSNIEKNIIAALNKTIPTHTKLKSIIWE